MDAAATSLGHLRARWNWPRLLPSSLWCCASSAGLGFRRRFPGSGVVFYMAIASLVMPGLFVGLGVSLVYQLLGWQTDWRTSGFGTQLTWTCRSACW